MPYPPQSSSPPSSPLQSSSPPSSSLRSSSPPSSPLPPSDPSSSPSSNKSEISFFDSKLGFSMMDTDRCASSPGAKSVQQNVTPVSLGTRGRSRISKPGSPPIPVSISRQRVTHDRMSRKHVPYPFKSALGAKESRLSTEFMKQELQLEQLTHEDKEALNSGLLQMSPTILYEGFRAMLAARETARQRLLMTAWEIEEAKRFSTFLSLIEVERNEQLARADEALQDIKGVFTHPCQAEVEGGKDYLQALQEDEREAFQIITAQAKHVSNLLGESVTQSFLRFAGDPSSLGYILNDSDVDSEESDD